MQIHLGWTGSPPPQRVLDAVDSARSVAAGCEVLFHDGEQLVPEHWVDAMDRMVMRPHMRSDVLRHAVLRHYGGLWLDADVRLLKSPADWAAGWDRYTAVRLHDGGGFVGTDLIYVPAGWAGWEAVEGYIESFFSNPPARYGVLHLAGQMIAKLARQHPEQFAILDPGDLFPFRPDSLTEASVVARGFDPAGLTRKPPRPGLGDLVKAGLTAVGITEERVSRAIGRPCGCGERAAKLNKLGTYLGLPPGSTAES